MRVSLSEPSPLRTEDALDELVNQFADPLSFLRELVQNSLDAGSDEVDIRIELQGRQGERAVAVIHVEDWGEGMNREIIEKKLTRLFSSGKDGDMTKIGKFGIGFVSVFAIKPEAVCVDTSREGESWRVLFDAQRKFKLLELDEPVDGTKIRIFKSMKQTELEGFVQRARDVLVYWCKHTRGEIRFNGTVVNGPLELRDAPCQVEQDDGFSSILVGHRLDHRALFGFYNTGLTLREGEGRHFDAVAFKASSPHLEHTLTRDNVIEDKGYARVMKAVQSMVDGPLASKVFAMLDTSIRQPEPEPYLYRAARWHVQRPDFEPSSVAQRVVARSPAGAFITLEQARSRQRNDEILVTAHRSPLSDALENAGSTVVQGTTAGPLHELLAALARKDVRIAKLEERYALPLPPRDDVESARWQRLRTSTESLLLETGSKVASVELGHFAYTGSGIAGRVAITQSCVGEVTPMSEIHDLSSGWFTRDRTLVVNADHPTVSRLITLAQTEPELAAMMLIKLFFLGHRLDPQIDGTLAHAAMEKRWRRTS